MEVHTSFKEKLINGFWEYGDWLSKVTGRRIIDISETAKNQTAWILNIGRNPETQKVIFGVNIASTVYLQDGSVCGNIALKVQHQIQYLGVQIALSKTPETSQSQLVGIQFGRGTQNQPLIGIELGGNSQSQGLGIQIYDPATILKREGFSIPVPIPLQFFKSLIKSLRTWSR